MRRYVQILRRVHLIFSACASLALLFSAATAVAQSSYPSKPIHLVVPFSPGGATDIAARTVAGIMSKEIGQPIVVENKPGGGGLVGARYVITSKPDGYTLLYGSQSTNSTSPALHKDWEYDSVRDLTAITQTLVNVNLLLVGSELDANSVAGLIDLAKSKPGDLNYGSAGTGSFAHIAGTTLWSKTGVDVVHVPYGGVAKAATALLGGEIDIQMLPFAVAEPLIKGGKVRVLGHTGQGRIKALPDVPPISDTVPGYFLVIWGGIQGPAGMPEDVVEKLIGAVERAIKHQEFVEFVTRGGGTVGALSGSEFGTFIAEDAKEWKAALKAADIKPK